MGEESFIEKPRVGDLLRLMYEMERDLRERLEKPVEDDEERKAYERMLKKIEEFRKRQGN